MANTWTTLLDAVYPIGSVYSAYTSTSPATRFGGTWSAITGRFPYYNAGTDTGGSNKHTLTTNEMPSHHHLRKDREMGVLDSTSGWAYAALYYDSYGGAAIRVSSDTALTTFEGESGGGEAHNNMPAYQTLYAWRRTA